MVRRLYNRGFLFRFSVKSKIQEFESHFSEFYNKNANEQNNLLKKKSASATRILGPLWRGIGSYMSLSKVITMH